MKKVMTVSVYWGIGYAGMWIGKWSVASLITEKNIFLDAWNQIKFRLDGHLPWNPNTSLTINWAIKNNLNVFNNSLTILFCAILLLTIIVMVCFNKKYRIKIKLSILLPLLFIGLYPFIWISLLKNHSIIHPWMVHRIFSITILAIVYSIVYSFDKKTTTTGA